MIATLSDLPLPAKVLGGAAGAALIAFLWSTVASLILLLYMHQFQGGWPLMEWWAYNDWYPDSSKPASVNAFVVRGLHLSAFVSTGLPVVLAGLFLVKRFAPPRADDDARWATWQDARRAGFSKHVGLYLGMLKGRYLRMGAPRQRKHIAIIAPTQSGKGVSFVLPAGLCDPGEKVSPVFFDPKFQAFHKTAGWQHSIGANVVLFAPLSDTCQTAQYNPCFYVRRNPDGSPTVDTWGDIESIVHAQIGLDDQKYAIFTDNARLAYAGVLAFLSETPGAEFTIPAAIDLLFRPDGPSYILDKLSERRDAGKPYSAPCAENLRGFLQVGGDDFRDSLRNTIKSKVSIFFNPRVRAALSGNTFDINSLMKQRTALYVGVSYGDISKLAPLLRLLFQQIIDLNTRGMPGADPSRIFEVPMVMDEFTYMGMAEKIMEAFGYAAEYGIRLMPVFQTYAQLEGVYGNAGMKRILDNCKIEVVLGGIKDMTFCQQISDRLGTTRGVRHGSSSSFGGNMLDVFRGGVNRSEVSRPLLSKFGVSQLPDDEALVMHGGEPGFKVKRIRYFANRRFSRRVCDPPVIRAIAVDLRFDQAPPDVASVKAPAKPGIPDDVKASLVKPISSAKPVKRRTTKKADDMEMSVAQAEATLLAVSAGSVDLSQFGLSPAAAKVQIDRVIHKLPPMKGHGR